ncbi:EF-P 5-aminopentanol modification-associated protein YfmH [Paraliobacillus salinarum]|uniref:EF-P 5-aminopentanol modification-associated protein YfmH n=1 Tax=Paraliobacillus salinarum TaxID=1158996 RepID=UPI0015F3D0A1|nr:pitrilysin family protein [Paraliobacillus salinarum]
MNKHYYEQLKETLYSKHLANGLQVYLLPKQEMSKTFAIFATDYGSIDQSFTPINQNDSITVPDGIAHFLEHKLFEKEDRDVFQDFTKRGASANAFTSFTKTAYLFSATEEIESNVETLIDFVQDPYFSDQSVEKEKGIIAQEIRMYDDQPDWRSFFGTIGNMYHNHPVQIDIAGTVDSIQAITKEDLYTCYETFYHPSNMILFISGNFQVEHMMELIETNQKKKTFQPLSEIERTFPSEPATVAERHKILEMPVSVSKCMVGIKEDLQQVNDDFMKQDLLADMLLDYFYSKSGSYYQELYEQDLIDDSFSFESNREKNFAFSILGGNTMKPDQLADAIKKQLDQWKSTSLTDASFERMKRKKTGEILSSMNSLESIAQQFIHYKTLGFDYFELLTTLEQLTIEEANSFLQKWVSQDNLTVFQVMPTKEKE